jgi:two-component system, cell cycle sensor histidine kinase and response regulator CckA
MQTLRILIVEDEALIAADIAAELGRLGYEVVAVVDSADEAIEKAGTLLPDLVFMDIRLRGEADGIEAAMRIRKSHGIPVIFLTAHSDPGTLRRAGEVEPLGYVVKPFHPSELRVAVEIAHARHRSEMKHRQVERWLSTTLQSLGDGVLAMDLAGFVTFLNHRGEELTAWTADEALGRHYTEVFRIASVHPQTANNDIFHRVIKEGAIINVANEYSLLTRDGRQIPIDDSAAPIRDEENRVTGVVLIFRERWASRDLEERQRRIEEKLRDGQKLESLGVLAGGIAHDFNNILTGILGHATLAASEVRPGSPLQSHLQAIEAGSSRAADLCRQMLAYAGKGAVDVRPIKLSTVVRDSVQLLRLSISKKATLKCEFAPEMPSVRADPTQLHQVMMNLIINASDATGEKGGNIVVTTGQCFADRAYLAETFLGTSLAPGDYAYVEVSDDGCGMDKATQRRIFDPFFTTKFAGRGLGLAAVLGIVRSHRGALRVSSEVGRGTSFRLLLPIVPEDCKYEAAPMEASARWRGEGTVLVVDDEQVVRAALRPMLKALNFDSIEAGDGKEGLELFTKHIDSVVAVLLDLTMPCMDGAEAFKRIRELRPGTPVILISGFNEQEAVKRVVGGGLAGFLQKPFRFETLRDKLHEVLTASG